MVRKNIAELGTYNLALTASIVGTRDRETNEVRARHVDATDIPPFNRESANHTGSEFARIMTPASGLESFWSMLKRGNQGYPLLFLGEAPATLRQRVLQAAQHLSRRYPRPHGRNCCRHDRQAAELHGVGGVSDALVQPLKMQGIKTQTVLLIRENVAWDGTGLWV